VARRPPLRPPRLRHPRPLPARGTRHRPQHPLVAVSRSGVAENLPLAMHWGPDDLVRAWR
jgi:hypothetical protein